MMRQGQFLIWGIAALAIMAGSLRAGDDAKPSIQISWYGYVKLDGSFDENLTSHGNFIMWVQPEKAGSDDDQFNLTANQTRLGLKATGVNYGRTAVSGQVEVDLYGGVTGATVAENKPLVQLRQAYLGLQSGSVKLIAGQTNDLLAPLSPSTLNYTGLWGCGNIGYRRPQVTVSYTFPLSSQTGLSCAAGAFRTIGSDLIPGFALKEDETAEGSDDGADAGFPSVQGRLEVDSKGASVNSIRTGISGLWGRLRAETSLGRSQDYSTWAVAGHLAVSVPTGLSVSGEAFIGSNLASYYGSILNKDRTGGIKTIGGWGSVTAKLSPRVQLGAGGGFDNPYNRDLEPNSRSHNFCLFGNVQYTIVSQVVIGLELSHWETGYKGARAADDLRAQSSFMLNF